MKTIFLSLIIISCIQFVIAGEVEDCIVSNRRAKDYDCFHAIATPQVMQKYISYQQDPTFNLIILDDMSLKNSIRATRKHVIDEIFFDNARYTKLFQLYWTVSTRCAVTYSIMKEFSPSEEFCRDMILDKNGEMTGTTKYMIGHNPGQSWIPN